MLTIFILSLRRRDLFQCMLCALHLCRIELVYTEYTFRKGYGINSVQYFHMLHPTKVLENNNCLLNRLIDYNQKRFVMLSNHEYFS